MNPYSIVNNAINSFFDGKINIHQLDKIAKDNNLRNLPVIEEIFLHNLNRQDPEQAIKYLKTKLSKKDLKDIIETDKPKPISEKAIKTYLEKIELISNPTVVRNHPKGLKNLGNTCFINSAIQLINSNKPLSDYLTKLASTTNSQHDHSKSEILANLAAILNELKKENPNQQTILNNLSALRENPIIINKFTLNLQHDSAEFMFDVFNLLGMDENPSFSICQNSPADTDEHSVSKSTIQLALSTDKEQTKSLKELIEVDNLGFSNLTHSDLSEFRSINFNIPRIDGNGRKMTQLQLYNPFDDITLNISDKSKDGQLFNVNLRPKSFICHFGNSMSSGHYVTIEKDGERYIQKSDSEFRELTKDQAEELIKRNAYIVNYEKTNVKAAS